MTIPVLDDVVAVVSPLITELAGLLGPVGGGAAAIVICTITLRLLLLPLTLTAIRGERARAALAPQVAELRPRLNREKMISINGWRGRRYPVASL